MQISVNPFYTSRAATSPIVEQPVPKSQYALLPRAPINASPVPHLTSLYHFHKAGNYGNRGYPGNCGGNLIKDLLVYFAAKNVFDPMTGSGTCADVCRELFIPCVSKDIRFGFDATKSENFRALSDTAPFDFVWAHPPYWRQKIYTSNQGDMSAAPTLETFLTDYGSFISNCTGVLAPGGKLAILMGDYCDREAGFVSLTHHTKRLAFEIGLQQKTTDIIRFSHGASSSHKKYASSFIPGLHDVCMIFHKS